MFPVFASLLTYIVYEIIGKKLMPCKISVFFDCEGSAGVKITTET